jgi:hypothetical protein
MLAVAQGLGMVLPEYEDPLPSLPVGTFFIYNTTLAPALPACTLMAFYGGYPANFWYPTEPLRAFHVSAQTSNGVRNLLELT